MPNLFARDLRWVDTFCWMWTSSVASDFSSNPVRSNPTTTYQNVVVNYRVLKNHDTDCISTFQRYKPRLSRMWIGGRERRKDRRSVLYRWHGCTFQGAHYYDLIKLHGSRRRCCEYTWHPAQWFPIGFMVFAIAAATAAWIQGANFDGKHWHQPLRVWFPIAVLRRRTKLHGRRPCPLVFLCFPPCSSYFWAKYPFSRRRGVSACRIWEGPVRRWSLVCRRKLTLCHR